MQRATRRIGFVCNRELSGNARGGFSFRKFDFHCGLTVSDRLSSFSGERAGTDVHCG